MKTYTFYDDSYYTDSGTEFWECWNCNSPEIIGSAVDREDAYFLAISAVVHKLWEDNDTDGLKRMAKKVGIKLEFKERDDHTYTG